MQTLLAPLPPSRSPLRLSLSRVSAAMWAAVWAAVRRPLRRLRSRLRRLARVVRAGIDKLGGFPSLPSLTRDPAVEAWLALGREVRRRRRLAGSSTASPWSADERAQRQGGRILLLRPHGAIQKLEKPGEPAASAADPDDTPPVNLRITM